MAPGDRVELVLVLGPGALPPELLLRVDPLAEAGIVDFGPGVSPTAAAAGVTLAAPPVYRVCLAAAPRVLVFQGVERVGPKVWIRVSSDRPVRAGVRLGSDADGVSLEPVLAVAPGASGRMSW